MVAYLWVVEERFSVVDAPADAVRQRPLSVNHQLAPGLVKAERRRVDTLTDRQAHKVPTEVVERHPAAKHASPQT